MFAIVAGCIFGLVRGMGHAVEPDHLAAVSTLIAERRTAREGVFFATAWGVGHALMLLVVGGTLFVLRAQMPAHLADLFEVVVGLMLVGLGLRALRRAASVAPAGSPRSVHYHGAIEHAHTAPAPHVHVGGWTLARRPLLVGVVHGLAGSGALTAFVVANLRCVGSALLFMAVYGFGAALGMALLAAAAMWPLARFAHERRVVTALMRASGAVSLVLGVAWSVPIVWRWLAG